MKLLMMVVAGIVLAGLALSKARAGDEGTRRKAASAMFPPEWTARVCQNAARSGQAKQTIVGGLRNLAAAYLVKYTHAASTCRRTGLPSWSVAA